MNLILYEQIKLGELGVTLEVFRNALNNRI